MIEVIIENMMVPCDSATKAQFRHFYGQDKNAFDSSEICGVKGKNYWATPNRSIFVIYKN